MASSFAIALSLGARLAILYEQTLLVREFVPTGRRSCLAAKRENHSRSEHLLYPTHCVTTCPKRLDAGFCIDSSKRRMIRFKPRFWAVWLWAHSSRACQTDSGREYGGFDGDTRQLAFGGNIHPSLIHAMACSDRRFLDFVEFCFEVWPHELGQAGVEAVNRVFREEAIGFEMTPFRETVKDDNGNIVEGVSAIHRVFPTFICKDSDFLHEQVVRPCL